MIYIETFSVYPLLLFRQIDTAAARFPQDLARRVYKANDNRLRALRAGAYILLERMARKWGGDFSVAGKEEIVRPEHTAGLFMPRNPLEAVHYDAFGKPYFEGKEDTEFNLSHSNHMAACVLSHNEGGVASPCGIDIELLTQDYNRAVRLSNGYFSEQEKETLAPYKAYPEDFCRLFTRIWTRKEALLKYLGTGLSEIRNTDTAKVRDFGCYFIETEETGTYKDPATGKERTETYYITVCARIGEELYAEEPEKPDEEPPEMENGEEYEYIDTMFLDDEGEETGDEKEENPRAGMTSDDIRHMHL